MKKLAPAAIVLTIGVLLFSGLCCRSNVESKPTPPIRTEPVVEKVTVGLNKVGLSGALLHSYFSWGDVWGLHPTLYSQLVMAVDIKLDREGLNALSRLKDYAERRITSGEYKVIYISKADRWDGNDELSKAGLLGTLSSGYFKWDTEWKLEIYLYGQFSILTEIELNQEGLDIISALKDYAQRRIAIGEYEIGDISYNFNWLS